MDTVNGELQGVSELISGPLDRNDPPGVWIAQSTCGRIKYVRPQIAARDLAATLLVQPTCKGAVETRPLAKGLAQIANRRSSLNGKCRLLVWCQGAEVGSKCVHGRRLYQKVKTMQHHLVNYHQVTETDAMSSDDTPTVAARRLRLQQWIAEHHGGSQASFAASTGVNQGELSGLLKRKSFGEKRAASLEELAGMPAGYLTSPSSETPNNKPISNVAETATAYGYVHVQQLDGEAAMGEGRINDDFPEVIRSMDFTSSYIRSIVGFVPPPGRLVLVTGRGDSMLPIIQPGESLLVDSGIQSFDGDGIYLINTGSGQQVKGLQDRGDAVYIVSANSTLYPAFPLPSGAMIGGKVYLRNRIDRFN